MKKAWDGFNKITKKVKEFEVKVNKGLSNYSDSELKELFSDWDKTHIDFWNYGYLPELSNWGGEQLLKRKILEFNKFNFIEILEALSAPEDLSFFQTEELELMKIRLSGGDLEKHQKKYYWIRNSYGFTKVLGIDFFEKEMKKVSKKKAEEKIKEINDYVKNVKQKKEEIIKKFKISKKIIEIANKLSYCIWWQDYRKQFIFIANHIVSEFMKEVSKRKDASFKELCYYTSKEVIDLLEKGK